MPAPNEITVTLHNVEGFSRKSGTDETGCQWIEYNLEPFDDDPLSDECADCGAEITSGWLCLDGGEVVCSAHIQVTAWRA